MDINDPLHKGAKKPISLFFSPPTVIGLTLGHRITLMHLSSFLKIPNCGM